MAVLLILVSIVFTASHAQNPNDEPKLISKAKSFDIYSIKSIGPNTLPRGTPSFMLNKPVYTRTSNKHRDIIKAKLRSLNIINDKQDIADIPDSYLDLNLNSNANNNTNDTSDKVVKEKMFGLAKSTIAQVDSKVATITTIHQVYKQNKFYKLGFIVSYINKTKENMDNMYKYIEKNKDVWNLLTLLNAYEQLKKSKETLNDMMAILSALVSTNQPRNSYYQPKDPGYMKKSLIAWNYYDDTT